MEIFFDDSKFRKIRVFNLLMGFLHLFQAILMLFLSTDFSLPITSAFVEMNLSSGKLEPVLRNLFDLQIGPLVAGFLFLSALAHFAVSYGGIYQWYVKNLKKGINHARWLEYALSSSLMMVVIALLVGVYDGLTLILMFFLNAAMILFGWLMELHNQSTAQTNWASYIFGCIAGAVPWVVVAFYLFNAGGDAGRAPTFVYWIFFSIFIFFNIFALNMLFQYKRVGKWKEYLYGERIYIVLSLVAKSLLAWQVFAGTLRPV
ncbi:hypothetical protein C4546_02340 [Candidatus Parcubacteria bacterium]|jgi:hypothetical protein|nr:MAG: hypothetical protein C4546_02340 [Candidatus Parcubacteria bacterium]